MLKQMILRGSKPSRAKVLQVFRQGFRRCPGWIHFAPVIQELGVQSERVVDGGADEPCACRLSPVPGFQAAGAALLLPVQAFLGK